MVDWVQKQLAFMLVVAVCVMFFFISPNLTQYPVVLSNFFTSNSTVQTPFYSFYPFTRERVVSEPNGVKCLPKLFGVSEKDDKKYFFSSYIYPNCSERSIGHLSVDNQTIRFSCEKNGMFVFGEPTSEEIYGKYDKKVKWMLKKYFVDYLDTEWMFAKCSGLRLGFLRNVFNQNAAERAKNITSYISRQIGNNLNARPLSVLLVIFDSVSRQSFFRNLNQTVAFLNTQVLAQDSKFGKYFAMYDFLINNAQGEKTPQNMGPILYGKDINTLEDTFMDFTIYDENDWKVFEDYQKENAIWKHYEKNGFVTLFSYDSYIDYLSLITGRKIFTDHIVSNFWRAANEVTGYIDFANEGQCIGNKNAHEFSLNYLSEYIKNYEGINRFAYMHIDVAHENTGLRMKIADGDILSFLEKTLQVYYDLPNEDVVLMLASDHGRMSTMMSKEAVMEKMMPFHLVFANKALIERMNAHTNLLHNTDRLVTRFDWHVTLKELALVPFKSLDTEDLKLLSESTQEHIGISLFSQRVSNDRDCLSVKIPGEYCSCQYSSQKISNLTSDDSIKKIISKSIKGINSFFAKYDKNNYCKNITYGSIISANEVYVGAKGPLEKKNYNLVISDKFNPDFRLKIQARYAMREDFKSTTNNYGLRPIFEVQTMDHRSRGKKIIIQIFSMEKESRGHSCDLIDKKLKNFKEICNCVENPSFGIYFNDIGDNCDRTCKGLKGVCMDSDYIKMNEFVIVNGLIANNITISTRKSNDILSIEEAVLNLPKSNYCHKSSVSPSHLCICRIP